MADAWGGSWGSSSAWGDSWGAGTTRRSGGRPLRRTKEDHDELLDRWVRQKDEHLTFTKADYRRLIERWAQEAAAKTAEVVDAPKKVPATKKAIIAAAKDATAEESVRLQQIWAETASRIAELEAIDSKYQKMADDLAAHFGRLAAEQEDEDEIIALLLS